MCGLLVMRDISATFMRENTFYDKMCEYLLIAFKEQSLRAERDALSFVTPPTKKEKRKRKTVLQKPFMALRNTQKVLSLM